MHIRIKRLYFIIMVCALFSSACNPDKVDYDEYVTRIDRFEIQAGLNTFQSHFYFKNNLDSDLKLKNILLNENSLVRTSRVNLSIISFNGNLGDLREVTLWLVNPTNTLDRSEAAYTIEIRDRQLLELDLIPSLSNLKDKLELNKYNLELELEFRRTMTNPITIELFTEFGIQY